MSENVERFEWDWNVGDPPIGLSAEGDIIVLRHAMHALVAPDDECGVRCSHGGVCTLPGQHRSAHDAAGHCRWGGEENDAG